MSWKKCTRCIGGKMKAELYAMSCEKCKETGATVCGDCSVYAEWVCVNCGHYIYMKPIKRKDLYVNKT